MERLWLAILGDLQVSSDVATYPVRGAQTTRLLGYLALRSIDGKGLPREVIIEALYPELSPSAGRRALSDALYRLRGALGPHAGCIVGDERSVALHNVDVDATAFRRHIAARTIDACLAALDLYRGDLLEQLDDDWVLGQRALLHDLMLSTLAQVCAQLAERGCIGEALSYAVRWVDADTFNETAHRTLMRLYAQSGRAEAALQHYRRLVAFLEAELRASPLPETQALAESIAMMGHDLARTSDSASLSLLQAVAEEQRQHIDLLALLGQSVSLKILRHVLAIDPEIVLAPLQQQGLITVHEGSYGFARGELRETILAGLISARLSRPLSYVIGALHRLVHQAPPPVQVRLAPRGAPRGRAGQKHGAVLVMWTVDAGEPDEQIMIRRGKIALRRHRVARLLREAEEQGAAPTAQDLAEALGVSLRTIEADLAVLRRLIG